MNETPTAIESFASSVSLNVIDFQELDCETLVVFHHNDSDGLSSGAILLKAFERQNLKVRSYCLEKPYPEVLRSIFYDDFLPEKVVFIFADFGSGMLPLISQINNKRYPVFILDHHRVEPVEDASIRIINPLLHGISGTYECSASSVCFKFVHELASYNEDLAGLAIVGAVGDSQLDSAGCLAGVNKEIFELSQSTGLARKKDGYDILSGGDFLSCQKLNGWIDALGSVSYLKGGPDRAIKGLLEGFDYRYQAIAEVSLKEYRMALEQFKSEMKVIVNNDIQWFKLGDSFSEMGVKTVGLVCQDLKSEIDPNKYIAGFQKIPNLIPGLDQFQSQDVKISMRVPDELKLKIEQKSFPPLTEILPQATDELEGFVDACHPYAAASTVKEGLEEELIDKIQKRINLWKR